MGIDEISTGVGLATGLISGITGIFQNKKANKLAKANVRPVYEIPDEIKQNQRIAQTLSNQGLPGAQYTKATQDINRGAASALRGAQTRRSGLAAIGAVQQNTNDATNNLNVSDGQQRIANIRNLMQQNSAMGVYRDKQWGWNSQAKYQENAAAVRALKSAGNANINTAFNSVLSAGAGAARKLGLGTGGSGADYLNNVGLNNPEDEDAPLSLSQYNNFKKQFQLPQ